MNEPTDFEIALKLTAGKHGLVADCDDGAARAFVKIDRMLHAPVGRPTAIEQERARITQIRSRNTARKAIENDIFRRMG